MSFAADHQGRGRVLVLSDGHANQDEVAAVFSQSGHSYVIYMNNDTPKGSTKPYFTTFGEIQVAELSSRIGSDNKWPQRDSS